MERTALVKWAALAGSCGMFIGLTFFFAAGLVLNPASEFPQNETVDREPSKVTPLNTAVVSDAPHGLVAAATTSAEMPTYYADPAFYKQLTQLNAAFAALGPLLSALALDAVLLSEIEADMDELERRLSDRVTRQSDNDRDDTSDSINDVTNDTTLTGTFTLPELAGGLLTTNGSGVVATTSVVSSQWSTLGSNIYFDSGNVSIGTSTASNRLTVSGSAAGGITTVESYDASAGTFSLYGQVGTTHLYGGNDDSELELVRYDLDADDKLRFESTYASPTGDLGSFVYDADSADGYVFAQNGDGDLEVIDISDPSSPQFVATTSSASGQLHSSLHGSMSLKDGYLYSRNGDGELEITDVTDPTDPQHAATYASTSSINRLAQPFAFTSNHIFFSNDSDELEVVDISDPTSPQFVATTTSPSGGILGRFVIAGDYLYGQDNDSKLAIIDISDPTDPTYVDSYLPGSGTLFPLTVSGDRMFVMFGENFGGDFIFTNGSFGILDISDPESPALLGITGGSLQFAYTPTDLGDDFLAYATGSGLILADISAPSGPAAAIFADGSTGIGTANPLADLDVSGDIILSGNGRYINFKDTNGSSGYGIRDNDGIIEIKDIGGDWQQINLVDHDTGNISIKPSGFPADEIFSSFMGSGAGSDASDILQSNLIGRLAGYGATSTTYSNFIGTQAGYQATDVDFSNFIGYLAGYEASGVQRANFFGREAGYQATDATDSHFIGYRAGREATNASDSVFIGSEAGYLAENAANSIFIGEEAGTLAENAANSIFIGTNAGYEDLTSGNSIVIGSNSGTGGFNDSIAIGNGILNSTSNQLNIAGAIFATQILSSDSPSAALATGSRVGIGTTTPASTLTIVGSGSLDALTVASSTGSSMLTIGPDGSAVFTGTGGTCTINGSGACTSDERLKTGFESLDGASALEKLATLRTGTYRWADPKWNQDRNMGVLAQDLLHSFPELLGEAPASFMGETDTYYTVNYAGLTVPLIAAVNELNLKLEDLAATATLTGAHGSFVERFFDRLIAWFADTANGIGTMVASVFQASEMICVDNECLTADDVRDLKALTGSDTGGPEDDPDPADQQVNTGNDDITPSGDTTPPVVALNGDAEQTIEVNETYEELGATAEDDVDGTISATTSDTVDATTPGTYVLTYTATDAAGNTGNTTRTVIVEAPAGDQTPQPEAGDGEDGDHTGENSDNPAGEEQQNAPADGNPPADQEGDGGGDDQDNGAVVDDAPPPAEIPTDPPAVL